MFDELLKTLSDFHGSELGKLESEILKSKSTIKSLNEQVLSLKEEIVSEKLINREIMDKLKEAESSKRLYADLLVKFKNLEEQYTEKQTYWIKFKEKIMKSVLKKKFLYDAKGIYSRDIESKGKSQDRDPKASSGVCNSNNHVSTNQCNAINLDDLEWTGDEKMISQKDSDENLYTVSRLKKGLNRDLSVAESMPWAQKQKDLINRPDYAYQEVIRKKNDRKRLDAGDCPCCKEVCF